MKSWQWQEGRQNSGYDIFPIIIGKRFAFDKFRSPIDCYIIRYRVGAHIPPHTDPAAPGKRHFRLNIILWPAKKGGNLTCEKHLFELGPIKFFRPDLATHSVSKVEEGVRYVLSIGWLRKV